jgi:hypothetical protein
VDHVGGRRAWPWLIAVGALAVAVGALTLGLAPWSSPLSAVVPLIVLAVVGLVPVATRMGVPGLVAAYVGLLAGMAVATWFRTSASEAGWGGFRSIESVFDWRLGYAACVAAGLFAVAVGYVVAGMLAGRADREPRRPWRLLGGALVGSIVVGGSLAVVLGSSALVIPEGSVILHVTMTDGTISLEPAAVPAGEVHFIRTQRGTRFDGPFMASGTGPQGVAGAIFHGPLTDADIAGLREGRLPDGMTVAEMYASVPPGEPAPWPTPDEYGGHERLEPGRYAWWTLEVTDAGGPRMKDLVFFEAY